MITFSNVENSLLVGLGVAVSANTACSAIFVSKTLVFLIPFGMLLACVSMFRDDSLEILVQVNVFFNNS